MAPDVVILDWQMPGLNGRGFVRMVRSPETFPLPDIPIIMLTGHGEKQRVIEAVCVGVNEFLLKPVSTKALRDRLVSVLVNPRQMVSSGAYYGPMPRKYGGARRARGHRRSRRQALHGELVFAAPRAGRLNLRDRAHRHRSRHDLDARDRVRRRARAARHARNANCAQIYPAPG